MFDNLAMKNVDNKQENIDTNTLLNYINQIHLEVINFFYLLILKHVINTKKIFSK